MENHSDISKNFIPYDLAVKLKELGFDEECLAGYIHLRGSNSWELAFYKDRIINFNKTSNLYVSAPLWQQAFDWFEDRYNLYLTIHGEALNGHRIGFYYSITEEGWINFYESVDDDLIFDTKEEARQACLEKLIELCKKN